MMVQHEILNYRVVEEPGSIHRAPACMCPVLPGIRDFPIPFIEGFSGPLHEFADIVEERCQNQGFDIRFHETGIG